MVMPRYTNLIYVMTPNELPYHTHTQNLVFQVQFQDAQMDYMRIT